MAEHLTFNQGVRSSTLRWSTNIGKILCGLSDFVFGGFDMYTAIAQAISLLGLACNVASYQQKKKKVLILCQLFGGLLFTVHFFMLGKYIGAMMNGIGLLRAIVFSVGFSGKRTERVWAGAFIALFLVCYPLNFMFFEQGRGLWLMLVEALPIVAMCLSTVSFTMENAGKIRLLSLFCSPLWLVYNIVGHSIGGVLCEMLALGSIFLGIIRHDIKKKNSKK